MDALNFDLLLPILVAHFLADFILQPASWVKNKNELGIKSRYFWLHIGVNIITLSLFVLPIDWHMWPVVMWVSIGHFILDTIKSQLFDPKKRKFSKSDVLIFIADQFLHFAIIVIVWLIYSNQLQLFCDTVSANRLNLWALSLAYLLLCMPSSVLIDKITQVWNNELIGMKEINGLKDAGKWIGIMERFLIFTFIAINQISAIGFLLAAKSVFRFGDINNPAAHKKTEYIIIGTLFSFSIAIVIGLIYKFITQQP